MDVFPMRLSPMSKVLSRPATMDSSKELMSAERPKKSVPYSAGPHVNASSSMKAGRRSDVTLHPSASKLPFPESERRPGSQGECGNHG